MMPQREGDGRTHGGGGSEPGVSIWGLVLHFRTNEGLLLFLFDSASSLARSRRDEARARPTARPTARSPAPCPTSTPNPHSFRKTFLSRFRPRPACLSRVSSPAFGLPLLSLPACRRGLLVFRGASGERLAGSTWAESGRQEKGPRGRLKRKGMMKAWLSVG